MTTSSSYQNTAKVHFNAHQMSNSRFGKRLIYGGHIISLARSLAFNGLENSLGMLGWNSGNTCQSNFCWRYDSCAWSDILETVDLPHSDQFGALRVGLVALKNLDPTNELQIELKFTDPNTEKEQFYPNIALHLDYYLLMPKK